MMTKDGVLDRARTKVQNKVQATIPVDQQVKAAHLALRAKRMIGRGQPLVFVERPIPDVEDVPLTELDVSNPFLFRQGRWHSYFKRLREEAPVHWVPAVNRYLAVGYAALHGPSPRTAPAMRPSRETARKATGSPKTSVPCLSASVRPLITSWIPAASDAWRAAAM